MGDLRAERVGGMTSARAEKRITERIRAALDRNDLRACGEES